jgi:uroporphyrinogen-III synthase
MPWNLPTPSCSSRPTGHRPRYFAIGRTTALALHTVSGADVRYPLDREISEVLLQLPELQTLPESALILRGNGGRELLGETLRERGADVTFVNAISVCKTLRWRGRSDALARARHQYAGGHQR